MLIIFLRSFSSVSDIYLLPVNGIDLFNGRVANLYQLSCSALLPLVVNNFFWIDLTEIRNISRGLLVNNQ